LKPSSQGSRVSHVGQLAGPGSVEADDVTNQRQGDLQEQSTAQHGMARMDE
jgi:hypothetical protein